MRRVGAAVLFLVVGLAACEDDYFLIDDGRPGAPRDLDGWYYAGKVNLVWELPAGWDGETFRVYGKRVSDRDYFRIAEVTNCAGGLCEYADVNVTEGRSYLYFVASVDPVTGEEVATDYSVEVAVPVFSPPPAPGGTRVVALDDANYLRWDTRARDDADFSFYRVYLDDYDGVVLLGETDSEGFLDELAQNGITYRYRVASVDRWGHESGLGSVAEGTPLPDYQDEALWAWEDRPTASGFRFADDESVDPIRSGTDPARDFRLEVDGQGWWLVANGGVEFYPQGFATTALKCGPGADADCSALEVAPTSGYSGQDLWLQPQTTYAVRIREGGVTRYAALRVELLGYDQEGSALMIFAWSFQLQPGNPQLAPRAGTVSAR